MAGNTITRADLDAIHNELKQAKLERVKLAHQNIMLNHRQLIEKGERLIADVRNQQSRRAVEFVNSQVTTSIAQANWVIGALMLANNEYNGILGLKDAQKAIDIDLLSLALIVIPGVGPLAAGLRTWGEKGTKVKQFLAHLGSNINDLQGTVTLNDDSGDANSLNVAAGSNTVIRKALVQANKQIGLALVLHSHTVPAIINNGTGDMQVKRLWGLSGLPTLDGGSVGNILRSTEKLDLAAKVYLYHMLREYTRKWVTYQINRGPDLGTVEVRRKYAANKALPEDGNYHGEFKGMSQAARDAIYQRFGNYIGTVFYSQTKLPPISGYRDMVKHWGLQVVL